MKKGKNKTLVVSITIFQIFLLISMSFAFSFILDQNLVSAQAKPSTLPIATNAAPNLKGQFIEVLHEGETKIAKYLGDNKGILAGGQEVSLEGVDPLKAKAIPTTPLQASNWEKTLTFNENQYSVAEAIGDPSSVQGLVENGQLTQTGTEALENAGIKNPILQNGKIVSAGSKFSYKVPVIGYEITNFFAAHLVEGLIWSGAVVGAIQLFGGLFGLEDQLLNSLSISAFGGIMGGKIAYGLFGQPTPNVLGSGGIVGNVLSPLQAGLIGVGIAAAIFIATYKKEEQKLVSFQCLPFEAPIGGSRCDECNKDPFRPCSEYRCKALGQACEIVNPGTTEEKCVWVNPKDVTSPTITPSDSALKPNELSYVPDTTIRPPSRGVKIVRGGGEGCLQAFTPLEFGITTNEPAQCKIDYIRNATFENMEFFFGETNYLLTNHTQKMKLPSPNATDLSPVLQNDGTFSLFVRCQDANGNVNEDAFVFSFCIDPSPDTTPPIIEGTSISSGGFIQFDSDSTPIELYINEPSECKWSRQDKAYEDMENQMSCGTETFQINANLNYVCSDELTGIQNQQQNKFYFRCKDNPGKEENERNVNVQSHELTLQGTQGLNILEVGPSETISGSTDTVPVSLTVKTDDGAEEGKAVCYFSPTGEIDSYITMFNTNNFEHSQELDLISGDYQYFFRCIDAGGNAAESQTSFSVFVDKQAPLVTRVYKELDTLKVITSEDSQCVYDIRSCNYVFSEGLELIYSNPSIKTVHFAKWNPNAVYYVKCRDEKGNEPSPNECSVIASAVDLTR